MLYILSLGTYMPCVMFKIRHFDGQQHPVLQYSIEYITFL